MLPMEYLSCLVHLKYAQFFEDLPYLFKQNVKL